MDLYSSVAGGNTMGDLFDGAGASTKQRSSVSAAPGTAMGDFLESTGSSVSGVIGLPLASIAILGLMALYLLKKYGD